MTNSDRLYIGIDGGGTKTELLATRRGKDRTIRQTGGTSNPQLVGFDGCTALLEELIEEALLATDDLRLGHVCVGMSGAGRSHEQEAIRETLAHQTGISLSRITVVSDADIALEAAFEGGSGVLVIAGTGSMVSARSVSGEVTTAGGWGRLLGDEGSGYAIGRAGLQAVAAAVDGGPDTLLVDRAGELFGDVSKEVLVRHVYGEKWPIQEFAPHVMKAVDERDAVAEKILREQIDSLVRRIQWLTADRERAFARRIALIGGLSSAQTYVNEFERALVDVLDGWELQSAAARPVVGALRRALSRS